jgi:hypothetical protein
MKTLDKKLAQLSATTAKKRIKPSRPVLDLIDSDTFRAKNVFHHGAGRPDNPDRTALDFNSASVFHYDPYHGHCSREFVGNGDFNTVFSGYVLNVLPPSIRQEAMRDIYETVHRSGDVFIAVRGSRNLVVKDSWRPHEDGYIVPHRGFQHAFSETELAEFLHTYFQVVEVSKNRSGDLLAHGSVKVGHHQL